MRSSRLRPWTIGAALSAAALLGGFGPLAPVLAQGAPPKMSDTLLGGLASRPSPK